VSENCEASYQSLKPNFGKGPLEKARSAVISLAEELSSTEVMMQIKHSKVIKKIAPVTHKKKKKMDKIQCKEKTNNTIHALEIKPMLAGIEQQIWKQCENKTSAGELTAHLGHRCNFLSLLQTCARNDSYLSVCFSDIFHVEFGEEEPSPMNRLAFAIEAKDDRTTMARPMPNVLGTKTQGSAARELMQCIYFTGSMSQVRLMSLTSQTTSPSFQ